MPFRDLFSERAELYSRYRPSYPEGLFAWIADAAPARDRAWDCATGNGQAATGLSRHFAHVIASDASESQVSRAKHADGIAYHVASACESAIAAGLADVATVAQAMHWIDPHCFFAEARRVLRGHGLVVMWGYGDPVLDSASLDRIVHDYNRGTIENYWMPERQLLLDGYRGIPFPFREIEAPAIAMEMRWTLRELTGYIRTWSATAAYAAAIGSDPVIEVEQMLAAEWGENEEERHLVRWPLFIRAGYVA